jgi:sodium transport system ATP-binding protein
MTHNDTFEGGDLSAAAGMERVESEGVAAIGAMVEVCDLQKFFADPKQVEIKAVDGVSFECKRGEIFGILGPNGAGKTTLLRMIATILSPTNGSARVDGFDVVARPHEVKMRIGFLSGNTKLYTRLTSLETVRYFGRLYEMDESRIRERAEEIFEVLGMATIRDRQFGKLSTGEKQKVSIARTLIHDPPVLILDEPTAGLDVLSSKAIINFIRRAREEDKTVILSTHYMTEAEEMCDRIGFLNKGKLAAVGTTEELLTASGATSLTDAFFHYLGEEAN